MELPPDLLDRPAEEAVRRIAVGLLDRAREAAARLADPLSADEEALHDFRVGLRRLRSCLRAYRRLLAGGLGRKQLDRLRRLAALTNPGRDAEVQLAWLAGERPTLRPHERPGLEWLAARLAERRDAVYERVRGEALDDFRALEGKLRARLSRYRVEMDLENGWQPRLFRGELAPALAAHADSLADALSRVRSLADQSEAHAARIEAKRLRYLLEPLVDQMPPVARSAVRKLRALQDLLGELNDAHVLGEELGAASGEAAAERARRLNELALADDGAKLRRERRRGERAGLVALATRLSRHRVALFARLEAEWLPDGVSDLVEEMRQLAADLAAPAVPPQADPGNSLGQG